MDNALKKPLQWSIRDYVSTRANDFTQSMARSIPCRVTKIDKDFVYVSFEPHNNVYTLPTVKLPQSFSPYAREPTQVGDLGYAVPGDYYLGGVSGEAGGDTNFYPRGNLTTLSFQPISRKANPTRDYDQYTVTGGPKGVKIIQNAQQQSSSSTRVAEQRKLQRQLLGMSTAAKQAWLRTRHPVKPEVQTSSTPKTYMQIDNNGNDAHFVSVQGSAMVWLGGSGKNTSLYAPVATVSGPSINVMAKIVAQDD